MRVRAAGMALALLMAMLMLGSCGKKGSPSAPGPTSAIIYPKTYPAP